MDWQYDRSIERIEKHLEDLDKTGIEVSKLKREMDLENLSETVCREIFGAHVYFDVANFSPLVTAAGDDADALKPLIQALHIYQREVSRIVEGESAFDGVRIHFQGAKVHVLFYRPIDDAEELATRAALLLLVLKDFQSSVFNPAFPDYKDFAGAGGADIGDAIGTRNGSRGDRELLFLGPAANHAAKVISTRGRLRLTANVYDALPQDLKDVCQAVTDEDGVYQLEPVTQAELDELLDEHDICWDREKSAKRVEADKQAFPLEIIKTGGAGTLIDLDGLSIRDNKRVEAASIFADVSGFTRYIDAADSEVKQQEALRVFHAIRREMARVLKDDFEGLRVQFQGDRVQGLFHLPKDDTGAIAERAVAAGAGLQSSMEITLKECLPEAKELKLAIGVDIGSTLVTKLGTRAHRDRICVGVAVQQAAACEEHTAGGEIGITKAVYDALPSEMQTHFAYDEKKHCYVAAGLTSEKLGWSERAKSYASAAPAFIRSGAGGVSVSSVRPQEESRHVVPQRPWHAGS